jgi:membrane fusion protein, multidrug efflux system
MGKTKKILYIIPLLSAAGCFFSCSENRAASEEQSPATIRAALNPTTVMIAPCEQKTFEYFIEGNGKIKPHYEQKFTAETNGILTICRAVNGKRVQKGDLLLQFDLRELMLSVERARLNFTNARIEFESQMLGYNRGRNEVADTLRKTVEIASGLSSARIDLEKAELDLAKAKLLAPFAGVMANVNVQQGMFVKAGDELFTLYSANELYVQTKILETDISLISAHQPADIIPVADPSEKYAAEVSGINPVVDAYGLVAVKLTLHETRGLLPGMNVGTRIRIPKHQALVVPKEAVVMRSGRPVVFTFEDGLAKWNYVVTGLDNGTEIEIKEGIASGQLVITSNNLQLAHDAPVKEDSVK